MSVIDKGPSICKVIDRGPTIYVKYGVVLKEVRRVVAIAIGRRRTKFRK